MPYYLPGPRKYTTDGRPMFVLVQDDGTQRWVIESNGNYFFCDENGNVETPSSNAGPAAFLGAVVGGLLGLAVGPEGVIAGAAAGAAIGVAIGRRTTS